MPQRLLLAVCALVITPAFFACGDDDGGAASGVTPGNTLAPGTQASTNNGGQQPVVSKPASKFALSLEDLPPQAFRTDVPYTFGISATSYAEGGSSGAPGSARIFSSPADGKRLLADWNYVDGYQTAYLPEGLDDALLKGGYNISVETHLFEDAGGARKAYDYFADYLADTGSTAVEAQPVGNKSSVWVSTIGRIGKTTVPAVYHQLVFVRGNVLTILLTKGARGFMKVDTVWNLAKLTDDKLLGNRAASEPTASGVTPGASARP